MTIKEIHNEVFEDIKTIQNTIEYLKSDFKRIVLKSSIFPLTKSFDCKTKDKKNLFVVGFTALKRSAWKKPIISIYGIYSRSEGKYAVAPSLELKMTSIYTPHFFKRYRERIVKDETISNEEIIRHYFKNDWGLMIARVNEKYESVYCDFEVKEKESEISFIGATSLGYCFGVKQDSTNIIKTIISEEMLFENQKNIFAELRREFQDANKNRYGVSV